MLVLRLGWRNLWRNPRRSVISISTMATAFVILALFLAMMAGLVRQLLDNGTGLMLGHLQLHHPEYLPDRSYFDTLGGDDGIDLQLCRQLESDPLVEAASVRLYAFALLSTGEHSAGAQVIGVDPPSEARVTMLLDGLTDGRGLDGEPMGKILLGEGLARELKASAGDEVAALTQAADGSLGNDLFRMAGVLRTGISHLDRSLAVTHFSDLQSLMAFDQDRAHEIALRLTDPLQADGFSLRYNSAGDRIEGTEASSWGELSPQLRDYLNMADGMYGFLIGLIGIFAALGVLNTMMMAVFERSREIGTVAALGMSPSKILLSFMAESFYLSLVGVSAGFVLSLLLLIPLTSQGIDLSKWIGEMSIMNARMDPVIIFEWPWKAFLWSAIGLTGASLLASALPARRAARMNPVEALGARKDS